MIGGQGAFKPAQSRLCRTRTIPGGQPFNNGGIELDLGIPFSAFSVSSVVRFCAVLALCCPAGCSRTPVAPPPVIPTRPSDRAVGPGVVYREFARGDSLSPASDAAVLDVDLRAPGIGVRVAAENTAVYRGRVYADCYTV